MLLLLHTAAAIAPTVRVREQQSFRSTQNYPIKKKSADREACCFWLAVVHHADMSTTTRVPSNLVMITSTVVVNRMDLNVGREERSVMLAKYYMQTMMRLEDRFAKVARCCRISCVWWSILVPMMMTKEEGEERGESRLFACYTTVCPSK